MLSCRRPSAAVSTEKSAPARPFGRWTEEPMPTTSPPDEQAALDRCSRAERKRNREVIYSGKCKRGDSPTFVTEAMLLSVPVTADHHCLGCDGTFTSGCNSRDSACPLASAAATVAKPVDHRAILTRDIARSIRPRGVRRLFAASVNAPSTRAARL